MGIPAFFRQIIEKYPKTHCWNDDQKIDCFFVDFNSIIYDAYFKAEKDSSAKITTLQFEKLLIEKVIEEVKSMADLINPSESLYLAMDGTAPRAKMIQQRWRRYKGEKDEKYFDELRKIHGEEKRK